MACKKYAYSIDTKEEQLFEHNDFIYNLTKDLWIKANKTNKTNKMYISEKQYYCLDRYAQCNGKRNYYITHDGKYLIILHKGSKQGNVFYYIATTREVKPNYNLKELLEKDKKSPAAVTIRQFNKLNSFCVVDLEHLEDLKEDEEDGVLEILEILYR